VRRAGLAIPSLHVHDFGELRAHQRQLGRQPGLKARALEELGVAGIGGDEVRGEAGEDLAVGAAAAGLHGGAAGGGAVEMEADNTKPTPANPGYKKPILRTPPTSLRLGLRVSV